MYFACDKDKTEISVSNSVATNNSPYRLRLLVSLSTSSQTRPASTASHLDELKI